MVDLVVTGGTVVDGTGAEPRVADIAVTDGIVTEVADAMNWKRLMWANDFPHSDSTWPWSQELLDKHTAQLSDEQTRAILSENVAELYSIDTSVLTTTA
jgi:predicted TIM-barrel fold metal-dependent hydrolase